MSRPFAATLVEILLSRAQQQPDLQAYTFLADGEHDESQLGYAALDRRARAIGAALQQSNLAGTRAILLYPPGLEYIAAFFGCLYAGVTAIPAYPPNPARLDRTFARLRSIVLDARPAAVLTTSAILPIATTLAAQDSGFQALRWFASDTISLSQAAAWQQPTIDGSSLAFIQYTSGSTAAPKGVQLSHANLLHNSQLISHAFGHTPDSKGVIWLPPYHDMGLIGGIIQPLYVGFPVILMAPVAFLQRPLRWLRAISRYRATTSGGPNFAYDLCVQKITPAEREELNLSSWQVAFNGAEPVRAATLERFAAAFAACGFRHAAFYPCYGLAEATLIVAGGGVGAAPVIRNVVAADLEQHRVAAAAQDAGRVLVGSGQALPGQQIAIVDPQTQAHRAPGQVGEIWVGGPSVAQGYWGRAEETEQTFQARIATSQQGPFLRTGDLGFIQDGELFITGRLKDLIIIRGRNLYPQDVELAVERSHPALRPGCGAAFAVDVAGEERLVIVQELERQARHTDVDVVAAAIRQAVAQEHALQVYAVALLKPGSIPKTSSGKIQRHLCRERFVRGTLETIGQSILDERLAAQEAQLSRDALLATAPPERPALLADYLQTQIAWRLGVQSAQVDRHKPLDTLGLDSLQAIELQHLVETELAISLPAASFLQAQSLTQLAEQLIDLVTKPAANAAFSSLAPASEPISEYPLSIGQRALWFLQQLAPESVAYNIISTVLIVGELHIPSLCRAFQQIVARHAPLRTIFAAHAGVPIQRVSAHAEIAFVVEDATALDQQQLKRRLTELGYQPFDLERGTPLRVFLLVRSAREHLLLLSVHHLAADLWSLSVLIHELGICYQAELAGRAAELPPLPAHYRDYVQRQAALLAAQPGDRLWSYWRQQLANAPNILELPADRPRPPVQRYTGAAYSVGLDAQHTQQLKELARHAGATLYMTLLAAFQVLLYRYTGQDDLLVGSPTTGRTSAELADAIGYYVNPVVLRARLAGNPSFTSFLAQVRQTVLDAFAHQKYPFALLVERLQPERDLSRSPLFQVMFAWQQAPRHEDQNLAALALGASDATINLGDLMVAPFALDQRVAQFDLSLSMAECADGVIGALHYNTDLFDTDTIARMAGHLQVILDAVATHPEQRIADLPLLTDAEQQQLLAWSTTLTTKPANVCIHELFQAQAAHTPGNLALVAGDERLTYRELNQRANRLAHYLRGLGVGPETRVGICLERSAALVIGLLGILKAGGAYVPLDPSYPPERLAWMLADAQPAVVLTAATDDRRPTTDDRSSHVHPLSSILYPLSSIVDLMADWPAIAEQPHTDPPTAVVPNHLAYVIYTSGSTGRPKGVALTHSSAVALIAWAQTVFTPAQLQGTLAATSISFDLSVFELFVPLSVGGAVILVEHALQLPQLPAAEEITLINTVPSVMAELLRLGALPATAQAVNLAGEPLPLRLVEQLYACPTVRQVFNLYGPTEDTTYSTFAMIPRLAAGAPTIGRPISNTQAYVLDRRLRRVPVGVIGELYLGGAGLARGYLNQPDLTAERFLPNPFGTRNEERGTRNDGPARDTGSSFIIHRSSFGGRLYRTGDLVRYRPDGNLEFIGRSDRQVKLRGFRIELGEIEALLLRHPSVVAAVVVANEGPGAQRLVAYVVPTIEDRRLKIEDSGEGAHESLSSILDPRSSELRAYLKAHLPDYMIPAAFAMLEALPLTPNGKIDRHALPAPDQAARARAASFTPARSATEERLAAIWSQILQIAPIGVDDNFFELGGHSLLATQVVAHIRASFQIELPLQTVFEAPTIATLAQMIELAAGTAAAIDQIRPIARGEMDLEALLDELEHRPLDELRSMLAALDVPPEGE